MRTAAGRATKATRGECPPQSGAQARHPCRVYRWHDPDAALTITRPRPAPRALRPEPHPPTAAAMGRSAPGGTPATERARREGQRCDAEHAGRLPRSAVPGSRADHHQHRQQPGDREARPHDRDGGDQEHERVHPHDRRRHDHRRGGECERPPVVAAPAEHDGAREDRRATTIAPPIEATRSAAPMSRSSTLTV